MKPRTATRLAWSLWVLAMAPVVVIPLGALGHLVGVAGRRSTLGPNGGGGAAAAGVALLFIVAFSTVGAVVASRRPENPIGWLLLATGLCYAIGGAATVLGRYADLFGWIWGVGVALTGTFVLLLFPTGSLPSKRWRPVAWVAGGGIAAFVLGRLFAPGFLSGHVRNPLGVGGPLGDVFKVLQGAFGVIALAILAAIVSVGIRFRRAGPEEREQLKWLVYVGGVIVVVAFAQAPIVKALGSGDLSTNVQNAVVSGALALIPIAIGVAILKYRLYDIDVVINKTLVYAALAAFITAVYVAIVVGIGQAIGSKRNLGLSILATAVVAVGFQPVRDRAQHLANRLVYGQRATPYEVLSEFAHRMAGSYATEDLLPRMARILGEGTGARRAWIWLKVEEELRPSASWPVEGDNPPPSLRVTDGEVPELAGMSLSLPVHHRGELLGALSLAKPVGERLAPAEEHLAQNLASGAGLVLRNVRLTAELLARLEELKASRQRIVAAQDSERRKLERNMHDGAQQQLVALQVRLSLAERLAEEGCRVRDLLCSLKGEALEALENLRDLARGIYPPLLQDQGLVAALSSQARKVGIPVAIEADRISRHPQEQEAAVYFCTLEALQNVTKYAGASRVLVRLNDAGDHLAFEIEDDGVGFDMSKTSYGTGLQGMADRLAALGGELEVRSHPGAGTAIAGRLPVTSLELAI